MRSTTALILWTVAVYQTVTFSIAADCSSKADVTFVLDSSSSVGQTNFAKQLEFVKNTVNNLDVRREHVQISTVTYSSGVHNQFFLNTYDTKTDVLNGISRIKYLPGTVDTGDAITYATQNSFSPNHGARSGAPHVMVLVTNGPSVTREITKLKAQTAKDNNILIYTVGVGNGIDTDELTSVASDPDSRYFLTADNFNSLNSLSDLLATKICNEIPSPDLLPQPDGCLQKADVVFMLDSSSSVGTLNFEKTENFIKNFVSKLNVGKDGVHVGLEQYSIKPLSEFPLRMYNNRYDVMRAIHGMQLQGGGTNTGDAIQFAKTTMFSPQVGARSNVSRIAIMITDGGNTEVSASVNQANLARQSHIGILGIGVGPAVNVAELNNIVDQPAATHMVTVNSYDQLETVSNQLMDMSCKVQSSIDFQAPQASCGDKINNCPEYGSKVCIDYPVWSSENCKAFCGHCKFTYTVPKETCSDGLSSCTNYGQTVCNAYSQWANDNCKQYCGFCNATGATGGFYSKCSYKGHVYGPGEKWYDGCDYECVCQDGASGKYQCYNRCPVYYNLPSMCTLIEKRGGCCLEPVCNFNPTVQKFESSGKGQNAIGIDVCAYKGKQYYQDQSWTDGCDYQCTCSNATKGDYQCEQLCPSYTVLPQICHLERTPGQCCRQPVCEFTQAVGTIGGNGMVSGNGTSMTAPITGPCLDLVTCSNYGNDVCTTYRDWAMKNCKHTCNFCTSTQQAGPNDRCLYSGRQYKQGEVWAPSCGERCHCENAKYGYYRCINTCPKYANLPSGCSVIKQKGECCPYAHCSDGVFLTSAKTTSLGGGTDIHVNNPGVPQFGQPLFGNGITPPTIEGCLYNGKVYTQNQSWMDGCSKYCVCVDAKKGQMSCKARCPAYTGTTPTCVLNVDQNDPCCKVPKCTYDANLGKVPQPVPTFGQASLTYSVVSPKTSAETNITEQKYITLIGSGITPASPTVDQKKMIAGGFCSYDGKKYNVGEKWDVGCRYNCICDDGQRGHYTCIEKCEHYQLPYGCFLVQDPKNPCCKVPKCIAHPAHEGITGIRTTPTTKKGACSYNGEFYQQGQTWYDGCSYRCTCEDAENGIYRCMSRCPEYQLSTGADCQLIRDPRDPTCCEMRVCGGKNGTSVVPPAKYTGVETIFQGKSGVCIYKGQAYKNGDIWEDGCDFTCQCDDEIKGTYSCTDRCPVYVNLQPGCTMVKDFSNPCCEKPQCVVTGIPPTRIYSKATNIPPMLQPEKQYCIYKEVSYLQGQIWEDGCSYRCRCDDSSRGIYTCNQRCAPLDSNIPVGCSVMTDPRDSCCLAQFCTGATIGPGPFNVPTPVPTLKINAITGQYHIPTPKPGLPTPTKLGVCIYKGIEYTQGQTFEDGCDYNCVCFDASEGKYRCTPKCPVFGSLPSACRLIKNPRNPCCKIPECYSPLQTTVVNPAYTGPTTTAPPLKPTTAKPMLPVPLIRNACKYNGITYTEGQQWYDGCDFTCYCEDGTAGVYRCNSRCPQVPTVDPSCTMQPDPRDPLCCKVPKCIQTGQTTPQYNVIPPRQVTGGVKPDSLNLIPQPLTTPSYISPSAHTTIYPYPTMKQPEPSYTPMIQTTQIPVYKKNFCVYKGKTYRPGQQWQDECMYDCECLDIQGNYRCREKCAEYTDLQPGCRLVVDYTNPCCKKPYCTPTTTLNPDLPTLIPPSPTTHVSTSIPSFCVYHGVTFRQDQTWNDGCDLTCTCENATSGDYRCNDRCPQWPPLPSGCYLDTDPNDVCCKAPVCQPNALRPPSVPLIKPDQGPSPVPKTTLPPTPYIITLPTPIQVGYSDSCQYNGLKHKQGERWNDGCSLECECLDEQAGKYRCVSKCQDYSNFPRPSYCNLVTDQRNPCCKVIQCNPSPVPVTTINPPKVSVVSPTPSSTKRPDVCVYKGVPYTQGQQWYDSCDKVCVCENGQSNDIRCRQRCTIYTPSQKCTMVPDPKDPKCCQIPSCFPQKPGEHVTGPAGQVPIFQPVSATPNLNLNSSSPTPNYCIYKNAQYKSGQRWQDGCDYNCKCVNGVHTCSERCTIWPANLPEGCSLVPDPNDFCCKNVVCNPDMTTPYVPFISQRTPPTYNPLAPSTTLSQIISPTPPAFCVYYGVLYKKGQTWDQDCQKKCRCDDALNNYYTCFDRCPSYPDLPVGCTSQTDPNDPCCQIPVCPSPPLKITVSPKPFTGSSVSPTPLTTPKYQVPPLPKPGEIIGGPAIVAPSNQKSKYCEYKGVRYPTGQRWRDGCGYDCVCVDGMSGVYKCTERCPKFPQLPEGCEMVTDVSDPCCRVPRCQSTPKHNVEMYTTTYNPLIKPTTPFILFPSPSEICTYKGKKYTQGQTWYDGCNQKCVCTNGKSGVYQCSSRCPQYDNQPNCILIPDPLDPECCKKPLCPSQQTNIISGMNPQQPHVGTPQKQPEGCIYNGKSYQQGERWQDGCRYTCECVDARTGLHKCIPRCIDMASIPPTCKLKYNPRDPCCPLPDCFIPHTNQTTVTPSINPLAPQPYYCIYNGVPYRQGQTFNVGCQQKCRCDDAGNDIITCDDRCPTYPPLKVGCQLLTDPNDQCCQAPLCVDPNPKNPYQVITAPKGVFTGGQQPKGPDGQIIPQNNGAKTCVYNGKMYSQGQKWMDGCTLECECFDGETGRYRCTEICARHPQIPSFCTLVQDPNNTCCQTVYCPPVITPEPYTGVLTTSATGITRPIPEPLPVCIYNGVAYRQGQQWYDGCNQVCRCEDAVAGYYRCQQRCSRYDNLPTGCTYVADPKDPLCCKVPQCEPVLPNNTSGIVISPKPVYGTLTGVALNPKPQIPGQNLGCFYNGKSYNQGQTWDDGCQYRCQCVDEQIGQYKCTERCQTYPNLPQFCTLVQSPQDSCCPVPYCDRQHNIPAVPQIYKQYGPKPTYNKGYCVYQGVYYREGQTWNDGCSKRCKCDDVSSGLYSCTQRCPVFNNIPASCTLVTDRMDPCCTVPQCTNFPTTAIFTGTGPTPTTPKQLQIVPFPVQGGFTGQGTINPYFTQNNGSRNDICMYKGTSYKQGQNWTDGCNYKCECIDALRGQYKCNYRCPQYYNLPAYCMYEQDPNDSCCRKPKCDPSMTTTKTTIISSTPTDQTTTRTPNTQNICVYKNTEHAQGSTWADGCDLTCTCVNGTMNVYQCKAKCRLFSRLPSQCTLVKDECCYKPQCKTTGSNVTIDPYFNTFNGSSNIVVKPGQINVVPLGQHQVFTSGSSLSGGTGGCVYKNVVYSQGQSWDDGCLYVCTCKNAQARQYECVSKCPSLPDILPSYCTKVKIPGQCCAKISCDIPGVSYLPPGEVVATTASPFTVTPTRPGEIPVGPITTTRAPLLPGGGFQILKIQFSQVRSQCIFHKKATKSTPEKFLVYNEGEKWKDGCEYHCKCMDGKSGYYYCEPLCPVYNNLPSNKCFLQRIDGQCCNQPRCSLETGEVVNPLTTQTKYTIIGSLPNGYTGFRENHYTNITKGCLYKERTYQQGQRWSDGCDFDCKCEDASRGAYSCTPRCPSYTSLPSFCTMVKDAQDCCPRPICDQTYSSVPPTTTTTISIRPTCYWCKDKLENCNDYGQEACQGVYEPWANRNCAHRCGLCDCNEEKNISTTPKSPCDNKLDNCDDFGKDSCTGIFLSWAKENCPGYCNLCPTTPTQSGCHDKQPQICISQKHIVCNNKAYENWAIENCQNTCDKCRSGGSTSAPKKCIYKGSQYNHGQSWKDGCKLNCTCIDGSPKCTNKCPIFDNLLPNWTLLPDAENCCLIPVVNRTIGCHYKGKAYIQDDKWTDGCSYDCVCSDASNGQYQCKEKCPAWTLPPVCTWLDPAPGKCCKQPSCPKPYVISGYPDE